jgi:hypothetical protein
MHTGLVRSVLQHSVLFVDKAFDAYIVFSQKGLGGNTFFILNSLNSLISRKAYNKVQIEIEIVIEKTMQEVQSKYIE